MTIEEITNGLRKLLSDNNYNPTTIHFYEREWDKIRAFLLSEYGDSEYEMERGLAYLEKQYSFQTKYNDGTLSQQRVQLLRVVHMLEDYRLHQVLTRRYHASKNPIRLEGGFLEIHDRYVRSLLESDLSKSTAEHYKSISRVFLDYLAQRGMGSAEEICLNACNGYIRTLAGYSFKTVEQNVCALRHLLRFLNGAGIIQADIASEIHMPVVSKKAKIPSSWTAGELRALLGAIDRNSPIGKSSGVMSSKRL